LTLFSFYFAAQLVVLVVYAFNESTHYYVRAFAVTTNLVILCYCSLYTIFAMQLKRNFDATIADEQRRQKKIRRLYFLALSPWVTLPPTAVACFLAANGFFPIYLFALIIMVAMLSFTIVHVLLVQARSTLLKAKNRENSDRMYFTSAGMVDSFAAKDPTTPPQKEPSSSMSEGKLTILDDQPTEIPSIAERSLSTSIKKNRKEKAEMETKSEGMSSSTPPPPRKVDKASSAHS